MKKKTNQKHLFFAADTEAQTVFNDEKLSDYINVTLKTRRGQLQHQLQYNPSSQVRNELIRVNNEIEAKSKELCNVMNTYLIGYAPISTKKVTIKNQDEWVRNNVKYWYCPNPDENGWEKMLDDIINLCGEKIKQGSTHTAIIYFHNLDYDAQHFLQLALSQLTKQPIHIESALYNNSLYSVAFNYRNCKFELRDSMKLYNQSLAQLGKKVGWQKQTQNATYSWFDVSKRTTQLNDEIYYFRYDIAVLAAVMRDHFQHFKGKLRLTAASYAEAGLKAEIKNNDNHLGLNYYDRLFNVNFTQKQDNYLRHAYYGGFVHANYKLLNTKLHNGIVADVNSLYPSVMLNRDYPDWQSIRRLSKQEFETLDKHDYHNFAIVTIQVETLSLKSDGVPVIPKKSAFGNNQEIYSLKDLGNGCLTIPLIDLYWIEKNYNITYEYITGIIARSWMYRPFKSFVLKHKKAKEDAVARHDKAGKQVAKIYLNSTYGKFAQRVIKTKTEVFLNDDNTVGFRDVDDPNADGKQHNILIAVFITAFARDVLFSMIESLKHEHDVTFWYCDTDAVHFGYSGQLDIDTQAEEIFKYCGIPYSTNIFGKWKLENRMKYAIYLGSKRYWEQDPSLEDGFIKRMKEHHQSYTQEDVEMAGAVIKGAGIQTQGKKALIKRGFNEFHYSKKRAMIVPFTVSQKVFNGVKIFESVKLIEPTNSQLANLENYQLIQ